MSKSRSLPSRRIILPVVASMTVHDPSGDQPEEQWSRRRHSGSHSGDNLGRIHDHMLLHRQAYLRMPSAKQRDVTGIIIGFDPANRQQPGHGRRNALFL